MERFFFLNKTNELKTMNGDLLFWIDIIYRSIHFLYQVHFESYRKQSKKNLFSESETKMIEIMLINELNENNYNNN